MFARNDKSKLNLLYFVRWSLFIFLQSYISSVDFLVAVYMIERLFLYTTLFEFVSIT